MRYKNITPEIKSYDDKELWIEHFISTETRDRGGDIMDADGMQIDGVPVVLWQHGLDPTYGHMPIAKPLGFSIGKGKGGAKGILARTKYPDDDEGRKLYNRTKEGFLPNWSIGYDGKGEPLDGGGFRYKEWTLYEYSSVAIPMNAEATHGTAPQMRQLCIKTVIAKAPEGYKDFYDFLEKTEAFDAVEGYAEARIDKDTKKAYGKKDGEWESVTVPEAPASPAPAPSPEPPVVTEVAPVVDPATTADGGEGQTKTLADEVKGDVAWMAMMAITDKFFTNLRACEPKKPRIRTLLTEYADAMTEHALAFCEYVSANTQTELVTKCEVLSENLKSAQVLKVEKYDCECIECGHKMQSEAHCKDIKCPKCGGTMRRAERPGPGQKTEEPPAETPPAATDTPAEVPAPPETPPEPSPEQPPEAPKALSIESFRGKPQGLTIGDVKQALADAVTARDAQLIKQIRTKILGRLD